MIKLRENTFRLFGSRKTRRLSFVQDDPEADRDRRWARWIKDMANGDIEALSALYDESSTAIFSFVAEIFHDREAAEDALVDIYDEARRRAAGFNARRQTPLNWLINLARDFAVKRTRRTLPSSGTKEDLFQHKRHLAALVLARLSDEQRSILEMCYLGGLTANEIASLLDVSADYVSEQIVSAVQTIRMTQSCGTYRFSSVQL